MEFYLFHSFPFHKNYEATVIKPAWKQCTLCLILFICITFCMYSLYSVLPSVCSTFYITFWLDDFDWLPDAQPSTLSVSLEGKGKNEMEKVMGLRQGKGYHLAITITDKTDLTPFQGKSCGFDVYYWFSFHLSISEEVGTKAVLLA